MTTVKLNRCDIFKKLVPWKKQHKIEMIRGNKKQKEGTNKQNSE